MEKFYLYNIPVESKSLNRNINIFPEITHKKIVVISPHSDDIAIGCGGTMALLSKANTIFPLLFFTGERGVDVTDKKQCIKIREEEMLNEASVLGLNKPIFLRLSLYENDNRKNRALAVVRIQKELKKINPDIIFLPQQGDCQPRHQLASSVALRTIKEARIQAELFFYETSWYPFGQLDFNIAVVFDADIMAKKLEAIRVHASQLQRTRFDIAAESLAKFRAVTIPEQRIQGYGHKLEHMHFDYLEVFLKKSVRGRI